jgi:hypothetical protein
MKLKLLASIFFLILAMPLAACVAHHPLCYPEPHTGNVLAATFTPDAKRLISLDEEGRLVEWNYRLERILRSTKLGDDGILQIRVLR